MQRLAVTCAALLALLVSATAASSASGEKLTLSEGAAALEAGNGFFLYGFRNLFVGSPNGAFECEPSNEAELEVAVLTNAKKMDELQIKHVRGGALPAPCRSFTGNADVELQSLGPVLKLRATGRATVGPIIVSVFLEHEDYKGIRYFDIKCGYRRDRLDGTNTATSTAQKLQVAFEGTLALNLALSGRKAKALCPGEAEMSLSLPIAEGESEKGLEDIEEQIAP